MSLTKAPAVIEEPAEVNYTKYCASCHGEKVEAFVDRKWKHGDKKSDILASITNGYPDAGMPTWKEVLTPKEIEKLADIEINKLNTIITNDISQLNKMITEKSLPLIILKKD
jgi:hypothetical protein